MGQARPGDDGMKVYGFPEADPSKVAAFCAKIKQALKDDPPPSIDVAAKL